MPHRLEVEFEPQYEEIIKEILHEIKEQDMVCLEIMHIITTLVMTGDEEKIKYFRDFVKSLRN